MSVVRLCNKGKTMSKLKIILYNVIIFVLGAAFGIGFWAVGLATAANKDLWIVVFTVSLGAIGVLGVINVVANIMLSRKYGKMRVRDLYDFVDDIRTKAQNNIVGERKKTVRMVVLVHFYLALLFVLICLCAFASGKADFGEASTILLLLYTYLLAGIFDILLAPIADDTAHLGVELTRNEFPLMHETASRAAAAVGYNGKIKLFMTESNISVSMNRGAACVAIGYKEAALFTSGELYAVMLHEFAHVVNADVGRAKRLGRIESRWDSDSPNTVTSLVRLLWFSCFSQFVCFNIELYAFFSSIVKEHKADELVRRLDGDGSFADALAKTEMIAKYSKVPVPEIEYYFFQSEIPPQNYATLDYNTYLKYCEKYGELWRDEIKKEIPPRVCTHPTAKMRVQSFGREVSNCNDSATETDPMYVVEQHRILECADSFIYERMRFTYSDQREKMYLERKSAIDNLDRAEANGGDLSGSAREKALWALLGIDDDRTIILADRMIAAGDRAPAANFAKGYVYRRRHDDRCVECFQNAAENPVYAEDAYNLIGEYALLTGNEQVLEKYRADVTDVIQTAQDKVEDIEFKSKSPTEPCDLDISVISEFAGKINEVTGNSVVKLYVCKYTAPDGSEHYPFAFELTRAAALRSNNDFGIYYAIVEVIKSYDREPSFMMCNPSMGLMRKVKHTNGVVVYDCVNKTKVDK